MGRARTNIALLALLAAVLALSMSAAQARPSGRGLLQFGDLASLVNSLLDGIEFIMDCFKQFDILAHDVDLQWSLSNFPKSAGEAASDLTKYVVSAVALAGVHAFSVDLLHGREGINKPLLEEFQRSATFAGAMYPNEYLVKSDPNDLANWLSGFLQISRSDVIALSNKNSLSVQPYFVVYDHPTRRVVVAVRGTVSPSKNDCVGNVCNTQTMEWDWLTNLRGVTEVTAPGEAAHLGMLNSARHILTEAGPAIAAALASQPGYTLLFTGHSLGAGVAALGAYMVKKGLGPAAQLSSARANVHATLYATPAVLSMNAAAEANSYMNTIFVQDDAVVRLGPAQIDALLASIKVQGGSISETLVNAIRTAISFTNYGLNKLGLGRRLRERAARARLLQSSNSTNSTNGTDAYNETEVLIEGLLDQPVSGYNVTTGEYVRQTQYSDAAVRTLMALYTASRRNHEQQLNETHSLVDTLHELQHELDSHAGNQRRRSRALFQLNSAAEHLPQATRHPREGGAASVGVNSKARQLLTVIDGIDINSPQTIEVPPQFAVGSKLIFPMYSIGNMYQIILNPNGPGGKIIGQSNPYDRVNTLLIKADMIRQHFLPFISDTMRAIHDAM